MTPPRPKSALARWLPLLLGAIAFLFLLATQDRRVGMYDEGSMLLGAERVLRGELPYRDFWTMYPPGQFYTLSWLFHGFGSSVLVERMWDLLMRTGIIVVVYRLLTARPPGLVVLSAEWEQAWEPNESQFSSGVTILDRFIAERYEPAAFFGPIAVLKRRTP